MIVLLGALPGPAKAQSRASLQVAARVLEAGPGLQALVMVRRPPAPGSAVRTPLATVRLEALVPDSGARRRQRITVTFVRN